MIHFEWPWAFVWMPLPLLARFLIRPARPPEAVLKVPFLADFRHGAGRGDTAAAAQLSFTTLAWLLLVLSAAGPQWIGERSQLPVSGRDLMMAIDISGSMKQSDFVLRGRRVTRIDAAKFVAADFIKNRSGDRIGLIAFANKPSLQMPLSFDLETAQKVLESTFVGLVKENTTAIGDAVGYALKRLLAYESGNRVLILLTDGVNNSGKLTPEEVAELAARENMKIYAIGIGSSSASLFRQSDLDEKTLKMLANKTGGRYFRAKNTGELVEIYSLIDRFELIERDQEIFRTVSSLYYWPLALAFAIALALAVAASGFLRT